MPGDIGEPQWLGIGDQQTEQAFARGPVVDGRDLFRADSNGMKSASPPPSPITPVAPYVASTSDTAVSTMRPDSTRGRQDR
jgi:hypothetical protein